LISGTLAGYAYPAMRKTATLTLERGRHWTFVDSAGKEMDETDLNPVT